MPDLTLAFAGAADALGLGEISIVEKDYCIVELLRILQPFQFESHQLVFAGGTALAKSGIDLNRMATQFIWYAGSVTQKLFVTFE